LALVPAGRRPTLVARLAGSEDGLPCYVFDIRLQGGDETVFFEA
jgi:protocatechuate 3,4-dioxygenase beta subunit